MYHEIVVGPPELKLYKPDPKAFDPIFEHFQKQGISERETIYIGDSIIDLNASKKQRIRILCSYNGRY